MTVRVFVALIRVSSSKWTQERQQSFDCAGKKLTRDFRDEDELKRSQGDAIRLAFPGWLAEIYLTRFREHPNAGADRASHDDARRACDDTNASADSSPGQAPISRRCSTSR